MNLKIVVMLIKIFVAQKVESNYSDANKLQVST
jgi:hypothetical protein